MSSDLIGYVFTTRAGETIEVVDGTPPAPGYVNVKVTDASGRVTQSARVEAQVRRGRELEQMTRWDSPDSDPVSDIQEVMQKGFDRGIQPTVYLVAPGGH